VGASQLIVLEKLEMAAPKTKEMVTLLGVLGIEKTALIATKASDENIVKSARNIPGVKTTPADLLNVIDLLSFEKLLMTEDAVRRVEELWGKKAA